MRCLHCDTPVTSDTRFCPGCEHPFPGRRVSREIPVVQGDVDLSLIAELKVEKARLEGILAELMGAADHRHLTAEERTQWERAFPLLRRVRTALTREMQHLSGREGDDRRQGERREGNGHADADRRTGDRRSGVDRRDPFPPHPPGPPPIAD